MTLMILGQGPLPLAGQQNKQVGAPGLRTWHLALALHAAGHQLVLVVINEKQIDASLVQELKPGLSFYSVSSATLTQSDFLQRLWAEQKPQAVIGVSVFPAYLAALYLPADVLLWADIFGSPLAEGQAKAFVYQDDSLVEPYARYERVVCRRADVFSTVSSYQKYALIGALATHGRFNRFSYGHDLVKVIPASVEDEILPHSLEVLRGPVLPQDAFVVLWSGGYNTWTDISTLFSGLEEAMKQRPSLHFVSTGGSLPSHDDQTYQRFEALVAASPYRERFHLLGWLALETLHNYYYEADLGIILDRWSYEGLLGSRTRLLDWLKYGLPAITTITAELTEILAREKLVFSFPHGDASALAALLLKLMQEPALLEPARARASQWVIENYVYTKVCQPVVEWANQPQHAPDAGHVLDLANGDSTSTERRLEALTNQLDQKNAHIAQVEAWAQEMEARLKISNANPGVRATLGRVIKKLR